MTRSVADSSRETVDDLSRRAPGARDHPPADPPTAPPSDPPPAPASGWLVPVLILVVGMFVSVLDVTIVNVAVPSIQKDFGGALKDVLWIATAYTLTLGVVVPLSGWLGDRFGQTRLYAAALIGFAIGSAACGLAWDTESLIAFRVLQAIPGGILPVVSMSLVHQLVPHHKMGAAMGVFGLGIVFAPATGPVLGGYLVQYVDWRLVFYINVPIGLLGALVAHFGLPKVPRTTARRFDLPGFLTIAFGLGAILLAAEEGTNWGWTSYPILMLCTFGTLSLALFVVIELQAEHPLLDLGVFRNRTFSVSVLMLVVVQVNLLATLFFVPVFLQQGQGKEAFDAGVLLLPQAMVTAVLMPIAGRLYDKIGARWLSVSGLVLCGYGTYLLSDLGPSMTREALIFWTCVRGFGFGLAMMPTMTAGLDAVTPEQTNQASALNNVARQVFGALGLALLSALATILSAQLFADRAALVPATALPATVDPESPAGFSQLYGAYRHLSVEVLGDTYGNLFLVLSAVTGGVAVLAFLLPARSTSSGSAPRLE